MSNAAVSDLEAFLSPVSVPLAAALNLPHLPPHFPTIILSALGFAALERASVPISTYIFPRTFPTLNSRTQKSWNVHVVSLAHAIVIVPLALKLKLATHTPSLDADHAFGWDSQIGDVLAFSIGYFLWDSIQCCVTFTDAGFVAHAIACLIIYLHAYRPFLAYFGSSFLLWEVSTIFLDFHWFMDKLGMTGSNLQLVNGVALLSTFFGARLGYGGLMSVDFFRTTAAIRGRIPFALYALFTGGNLLLQGLNYFWFYKMIASLRKRFSTGRS